MSDTVSEGSPRRASLPTALLVVVMLAGCGGPSGPPPTNASYRAQELAIVLPTALALANLTLQGNVDAHLLNLLIRVTDFDSGAPSVEIGTGEDLGGEYSLISFATLSGALDEETGTLVTTGTGSFVMDIVVDQDGDGTPETMLPLTLTSVTGEPMLTAVFNNDWSEVTDDTRLVTGITVDNACLIDFESAPGVWQNLLDLLDGATGDTLPPSLPPDPCAPGAGPDNRLPTVDTDGDGVDEAYRIETLLAGGTVTIQ